MLDGLLANPGNPGVGGGLAWTILSASNTCCRYAARCDPGNDLFRALAIAIIIDIPHVIFLECIRTNLEASIYNVPINGGGICPLSTVMGKRLHDLYYTHYMACLLGSIVRLCENNRNFMSKI